MKRPKNVRNAWCDAIETLRVGSVQGAPAVNKPLLLLLILARAERGQRNEFKFPELEHEIRETLVRFGPKLRAVSPSCGFMHLRNDGFWHIRIKRKEAPLLENGCVSQATLRHPEVFGMVEDEMWRKLVGDPTLIRDLANLVINKYLPSQDKHAIAEHLGIALD